MCKIEKLTEPVLVTLVIKKIWNPNEWGGVYSKLQPKIGDILNAVKYGKDSFWTIGNIGTYIPSECVEEVHGD